MAKFLGKTGAFTKTGKAREKKAEPKIDDEENEEEEEAWWDRMERYGMEREDPQRSAELPPMPTPTSANSDTSPANSDGPLANFGACPAATDTYPGLPKPREPPPLFLIFAHPSLTQHPASSDLFRNITTTSEQPAIPSTYQRGTIFDHNRHPPTPSSPAKPRRHSRRTPKSSG
ncbi:hypothetical protein E4T56_gene10362, partial [Termitomyces sp. T112]